MRLMLKFSIIFIVIFAIGLAITGYVCRGFLFDDAREQVLNQARVMLQSTLSTREYTAKQIEPLILGLATRNAEFYPQTVPEYAAIENFSYLHKKYPEYSYREATLNPTNLRDKAMDWEADIIRIFRDQPAQQYYVWERDTPAGRSLLLARPIVSEQACLRCHSTPRAAPASMVRKYGSANGFGWQLNEIVGAQIVSVPMAVPIRRADAAFMTLMTSLVAVGISMLILLNGAIHVLVVRPATLLARNADAISLGKLDIPQLPVTGRDEISMLADAFNRMHRSLAHAMKMLDDK